MKGIILTLFAVIGYFIDLSAQKAIAFGPLDYYHAKVMDDSNHLDSWHKDENGPFEYILDLSANWWKNSPDVNGWPIWCTAALLEKPYIQGAGAIPGSACSFAIMACIRYYVYTGDTTFLYMAKRTGDYIIKQDLTPSYFAKYPNFPYAVGKTGDIHPQGTGHPGDNDPLNPVYSIQPDKGAMLGVALLELYKITGNQEFLQTSVNIANCLSANAVPGNAKQSPWPMRVMADDGSTVDGEFSANVSFACRLFDELLRIGQTGNGKYKSTRDAVWNWLNTNVIAFDDGSKWCNFFEDHGGDENNSTQINALETVRYLLEKKSQADPDWFNLSKRIINQVTRRWSVSSLQKDGYVSIGEQDMDMTPYNSHAACYGSILAMYNEAGANIAYRDTAYHSLCYGLYSVENDGYTNTYFTDGGVAWTTDSFGDFLYHYIEAMAAVSEWTTYSKNHLLKSTNTITKVSYIDTTQVIYSTFYSTGTDKLKLTNEPVSVEVDGLNIKSYIWDNNSKVLIINRSNGKNVIVSLVDTTGDFSIPNLFTNPVFGITSSAAISGGNVIKDGGAVVTARGVCWSTSTNPTITGSHTTDGSGTGNFESSITGLNDNTTYYVRAYATNKAGTAYGNQIAFTTSNNINLPSLSTSVITNITETTAIGGGNVTSDGGASVTVRGVCWNTSENPTTENSKTEDGSGTGSFTSNLNGLTNGTSYHVRAYATNSVGTGYGEDIIFMSLVTGISKIINPKILIYPNPTNGYLSVESDQSFTVGSRFEIYDYYGRIAFQKNLEEGVKHDDFDLTSLQKGMYFIRVQNNYKDYFQKIVIQ